MHSTQDSKFSLASPRCRLGGSYQCREGIGLQQAMLLIPALNVLLALVFYLGSRTIVKDIARREAASVLAPVPAI